MWSRPSPWDPTDCSPPSSLDSPVKNTGGGCHSLLQGIFLARRSNLQLFCLLHWQAEATSTTWEVPFQSLTIQKDCLSRWGAEGAHLQLPYLSSLSHLNLLFFLTPSDLVYQFYETACKEGHWFPVAKHQLTNLSKPARSVSAGTSRTSALQGEFKAVVRPYCLSSV